MKKLGYVKVENGAVSSGIRGKLRWFVGGDSPNDGEPVTDDAVFIEGGWYPVYDDPPEFDPATQQRTANNDDQWTISADRVEVTYTITDKTQQEIDRYWYNTIANKREERLNTQIDFTDSSSNVHSIPVTNRSMSLILPARSRAQSQNTTRPFPTSTGIKEFSAADLLTIEETLDNHVSAVFRREAELQAKVADGTITQQDVDIGWP